MARQKQDTSGGGQLGSMLPSQAPAAGHPEADEMVRAVGASIRAARKRRRLTLQELGERPPSPVRRLADQVTVQAAERVSRRLVHTDLDNDLEMVVNEYEPGTSSAPGPVHHEGSEFGLVISGVLTVRLGGVDYVLGTGDGIAYESATPHVLTNHGPERARAVWINVGFGQGGQHDPGHAG